MKFSIVLFLVLAGFCSVTNASAQDLDLTVEFVGPWAFVQTSNGIVAIAPSNNHLPAQIQGAQSANLLPGIYSLALSNPRPGNLPSGAQSPNFVPAKTTAGQLASLTKNDPKGKPRYALSLPPGGVFELAPSTSSYETYEEASISDYFEPFSESPQNYAKVVKIHYTVSDLSITLSGTADVGNWHSPFKSK